MFWFNVEADRKEHHMQNCDFIFRSKKVFTSKKPLKPQDLAIAVRDARILAVDKPEIVSAEFSSKNGTVDFGDSFLCPGFHDAHLHFFHTAIGNSPYMLRCLGKSEADLVEKTKEFAKNLPPDAWVVTQGWRYYRWTPAKYPSKDSIDKAFSDRPCVMYSGDGHTLWLNTCAMNQLGLLQNGASHKEIKTISRSQNGANDNFSLCKTVPAINVQPNVQPTKKELQTGIFHEKKAMKLLPFCLEWLGEERIAEAYENEMKRMSSLGITSVCDMSLMPLEGSDFVRDDIFERLNREEKMCLRVHMFPTLLKNKSRVAQLQKKFKECDFLYAPGFKQFFDGVSSEHTAYLTEPYTNARFKEDCGELTIPHKEMRDLVLSAASDKQAVRIHTIGDCAIHCALDIFEEAIEKYGLPETGNNTLEHVENILEEDISRLKECEVVVSSQPCHITLDPGGPERDLGEMRCKLMWPFKTFEKEGITQAFGSDSPITKVSPMDILYTAVTRKDPSTHLPEKGWHPEQNISIAKALQYYTLGSAIAAGNERNLGSLEPGKFADFVVLQNDLLTIEAEKIQSNKVLATYLGGKCVYSAKSL